jgi:pyruvate-ferredoxin/flavodoxin oxidoreductase
MTRATVDGNEAAASVAYRLNEVCCIYPITPSSPMAELADEWSSQKRPNLWGGVPSVVEMQHEGGAAGALRGALQSGALATTFTASQGLLLMIPNMYKIAGELTPAVLHVAARSLAAQGLSIFGDHSDVMAVRASRPGAVAGAAVHPGHRAEPGRLLPGAGDGEPVLRRRARRGSGRDRRPGRPHRPPVSHRGLHRSPRSRAGDRRDGLGG